MLKISNEAKVGILAIGAIAILIWGYSYLKGKNIFNKTTIIYAEYANIDGLGDSDPVLINGYKVGLVDNIYLKSSGKLVVVMALDKPVKIPRATAVASIASASLMGGKVIQLSYTGECTGGDCLVSGDTVVGVLDGMFAAVTKEIDPYLERAQKGVQAIDSIFKSLTQNENSDMAKTLNDFQATIANLNAVSAKLDRLLAASTADIAATLDNLNAISGNLKTKNAEIDNIISDVAAITDQVKRLQLDQTLAAANTTIKDLDKTIATIDLAANEAKVLIQKINNKEGTLGMLANDTELYTNLNNLAHDLDLLSRDLRLNPKRYINLRKKNQPYDPNTPDPDDTANK